MIRGLISPAWALALPVGALLAGALLPALAAAAPTATTEKPGLPATPT